MYEREIVDRLARIETTLTSLAESVKATNKAVYGNGRAGLETRVDRLEQSETSRRWTVRAVVGAGLVFLGDLVIRLWK